ncbi:hypothetical protein [Alkalilimnicola ehrlichii]|nr:hypothetical protein [Alkalilimnicola ehrlichii]
MAHAQAAYYVPHRTVLPIIGTIGLTLIAVGASGYLQGLGWGGRL